MNAIVLSNLGPDRQASTRNRRDWDGFIAWRRRGGDTRRGEASGRKVGARIVEYDLKFLQAVLNWAVTARDSAGRYLLDRNPLKGMPWPKEDSPRRPVLTTEDYAALLKVAPLVDERCGDPLARRTRSVSPGSVAGSSNDSLVIDGPEWS